MGGFLFLFAHMQEKLSKNSTQVDLLQELLNLQKDLIVMMLSMLEGTLLITNKLRLYFRTTFLFLSERTFLHQHSHTYNISLDIITHFHVPFLPYVVNTFVRWKY